jgi:hypothetical protein
MWPQRHGRPCDSTGALPGEYANMLVFSFNSCIGRSLFWPCQGSEWCLALCGCRWESCDLPAHHSTDSPTNHKAPHNDVAHATDTTDASHAAHTLASDQNANKATHSATDGEPNGPHCWPRLDTVRMHEGRCRSIWSSPPYHFLLRLPEYDQNQIPQCHVPSNKSMSDERPTHVPGSAKNLSLYQVHVLQ